MEAIGSYEAKTHLPKLLDAVERGQTYIITKHGREVARLVPARRVYQPEQAIRDLREARQGARLAGVSIRELIDEGRR